MRLKNKGGVKRGIRRPDQVERTCVRPHWSGVKDVTHGEDLAPHMHKAPIPRDASNPCMDQLQLHEQMMAYFNARQKNDTTRLKDDAFLNRRVRALRGP